MPAARSRLGSRDAAFRTLRLSQKSRGTRPQDQRATSPTGRAPKTNARRHRPDAPPRPTRDVTDRTRLQDRPRDVNQPAQGRRGDVPESVLEERPMGLLLVGDVLTVPRPMGPSRETVTFSRLSLLRVPAARSRLGSRDAVSRSPHVPARVPWDAPPSRAGTCRRARRHATRNPSPVRLSQPESLPREPNRVASRDNPTGERPMGLLLVGDVLTAPRPMGQARELSPLGFVPRDAALRTLQLSP